MYPTKDIIAVSCGSVAIFDFEMGFGYICETCGFKIKGDTNECQVSGHGRLDTSLPEASSNARLAAD